MKYVENKRLVEHSARLIMTTLIRFLNDVETVNMSGYLRYRREHSDRLLDGESSIILDFLAYSGFTKRAKKAKTPGDARKSKSILVAENEIPEFLYHLTSKNEYSKHTLHIYDTGLKFFFSFTMSLSNDSVRDYVRYLESQKLSPKTIRLRLLPVLRFAEFKKKIISVKLPKVTKTLSCENLPSEKEYNALIEYLLEKKNKKYYLYVKILATTGLRHHEFLGLKWQDIINGETVIKGKGSKYRRVFFQKSLISEVRKYVPEKEWGNPCFLNRYGLPASSGALPQLMRDWSKAIGIDSKKIHPHAFRHFFAKQYLKRNNDVIQLAEYLGHSNLDTTRIYLQKTLDEQKSDFNRHVKW